MGVLFLLLLLGWRISFVISGSLLYRGFIIYGFHCNTFFRIGSIKCRLFVQEIEHLSYLEQHTLSSDLSQGYALKMLAGKWANIKNDLSLIFAIFVGTLSLSLSSMLITKTCSNQNCFTQRWGEGRAAHTNKGTVTLSGVFHLNVRTFLVFLNFNSLKKLKKNVKTVKKIIKLNI